jgi:hypothetical protein
MSTLKGLKAVVTFALVSFGANAIAAPISKGSSSSGGKSGGRDWLLTLPLFAGGALHAEYNAGGVMGLALEYSAIAAVEELMDEEILETGNFGRYG